MEGPEWGGLVLGHSWCWVGVLGQSQCPEGILVPWVWVPNHCGSPGSTWAPGVGVLGPGGKAGAGGRCRGLGTVSWVRAGVLGGGPGWVLAPAMGSRCWGTASWVSPGSWVGVRVGVCVLDGVPVPGDGGQCPRSVPVLREGPGSRGQCGCLGTGSRLSPGVPRGVRCSVPVSWVGVPIPGIGGWCPGSVPVQVPGAGVGSRWVPGAERRVPEGWGVRWVPGSVSDEFPERRFALGSCVFALRSRSVPGPGATAASGGAGGGGGFKRCPGPARPVPGRDRPGGTERPPDRPGGGGPGRRYL